MKTYKYDILIIGGGPIGASTFYFLKDSNKKIALIRPEPLNEDKEHIATYLYAGGSVRWYFEDEEVGKATKKTADFIKSIKDKVDLSLIEDYYVFLNKGIMVPSLNISGTKLINYFLKEGKKEGKEVFDNTYLEKIEKVENRYVFVTNNGIFEAEKVLLAIGYSVKKFFPDIDIEFKKRQLFVFDLVLKEEQKNFPHITDKINGGVVYVFIKKIGNDYKFVLGQEDIVEEDNKFEGTNYFRKLKEAGVLKIFPFLEKANVENILWGFDAENKKLKTVEIDNQIIIANCGSAVRSCAYIGRTLKERLLNN